MKKYIVTLLIVCVVSLGLSFLLEREILRNIGIGLLLTGIALSGTAVSGDRMRVNQENSELGFRKNYFLFPFDRAIFYRNPINNLVMSILDSFCSNDAIF